MWACVRTMRRIGAPRVRAAFSMPGADPARLVSMRVSPSSSLTRKQLIMPKRVRRKRFLASCLGSTPLPKRGIGLRWCWRWIRFGFFEEDDFFDPRVAAGDNQIGGDLVARSQRFGLFGDGVAHGHRRHQSWNVSVFYDNKFLRQFNRDNFGLDRIMPLFGLGFTPCQDGNQYSLGQYHECLQVSHWLLTPFDDSHEQGRGGKCWRGLPSSGPPRLSPPLQMKTVAHLDVEFARIQVVSSAESKTVVEENAAIGDVQGLNVYGEPLTETLSQREVKCGVRLEMIAGDQRVAVGEAGGVVDVGRSVGMEWEIVAHAEVQGVALVVIEELEALTKGKVGESAVDVAKGEGQLIRIG